MEELRSTEILDKEIHADARQKVEVILKNAEEECKRLKEEIAERVESASQEKQAFYTKKIKAAEQEMDAVIPLEKSRFELSFTQSTIMECINEYLKALPQEKHIELLLSKLDKEVNLFEGKKINAFVYGLDIKLVKNALSKKLGQAFLTCEKTDFGKILREEEIGLDFNEGIILESEDKTLRCRLTLVQVFTELLDKYRAELAAALFGNK
ncbi:MAG: hypothetical protein K5829_09550 [Treponema sp.]|nr:hypothetical protein [Treponema sp.]